MKSRQDETKRTLRRLGFNSHRLGFWFIVYGVEILAETEGGFYYGREIYARIGEKFSVSEKTAEKDITNAIRAAKNRGSEEAWRAVLAHVGDGKITNKGFLCALSEIVKKGGIMPPDST